VVPEALICKRLLSAKHLDVEARSVPDSLAPDQDQEDDARLGTVVEEGGSWQHANDGIYCRIETE
jgi:hypothetical protein